MDLLAKVEYDCVFAFKYSARPNTPSLVMIDSIPEAEKASRLQVLLERQREIQRVNYSKHIGEIIEVMVEGAHPARGQIAGRSSQNKPVNLSGRNPSRRRLAVILKYRSFSEDFHSKLFGKAPIILTQFRAPAR